MEAKTYAHQNATFAAGTFTFSAERNEVVDFTVPIMSDPMVVLFQRPELTNQWWSAFRPVSPTIWGITFTSLVIVAIFSTLFSRFSPFSAVNLCLPFSIADEVRISENVWTAVGVFLLQGQDFYVYSLSARVVSVTWWIFCAIFIAVYSADLTSFITTYSGPTLPKSLQEFADSDTLRLYLSTGFASTSNIQKSNDTVIQKIASKSILVPNFFSVILSHETSNSAIISDYSWTLYTKSINCTRYDIVTEILEASFTGFLVPKYADFKIEFDRIIQTLSDNGVIKKWFQEDLKGSRINQCIESSSDSRSIDMNAAGGIFLVTMSFYLLGLLLVALECALTRLR